MRIKQINQQHRRDFWADFERVARLNAAYENKVKMLIAYAQSKGLMLEMREIAQIEAGKNQ